MTQPSRDPSAPAPPLATPALDLMRLLLHVGHGLERLSLRMESRLGVTAQQRLVLRLIGRHPGITPGRLAERLHLDPGTISAIVRRLEAKKLVRRGSDPRDRDAPHRPRASARARGDAPRRRADVASMAGLRDRARSR
ncbi:MAG: MarR family transcriptional regulator [Deltaproteobacteria bacterium]